MDTATWETDEVGAYLRLLLYEWVNGGLPDDTYKLSKIVRESERKFKEKWKNLSQKFTLDGNGLLVNRRMEEVRQMKAQFIESQREKGVKSAKKRWGDRVTPVITTVEPVLQPDCNLSISSSISSSLKDKIINNKHIAKSVKKPPSPDVKLFIDFYFQEFENQFLTPPMIEWGRDGKTIKDLLSKLPLEELKSLLIKFFDSSDKFIQNSGYTLTVFRSQINKLKINGSPKDGMDLWLSVHEEKEKRDGIKRQEALQLTHEEIKSNISIESK